MLDMPVWIRQHLTRWEGYRLDTPEKGGAVHRSFQSPVHGESWLRQWDIMFGPLAAAPSRLLWLSGLNLTYLLLAESNGK